MGYTHYWEPKRKLEALDNKTLEAIRNVLEQFSDIVCYEEDEEDRPPEVTPTSIQFNGTPGNGYETFCFNLESQFQFCKTARHAYDTPVVAILIILKQYYGDALSVSSDGYDEDWQEGINVAQILGYTWNSGRSYNELE